MLDSTGNTGHPANFSLTKSSSGKQKFALLGGADKVTDNVFMLMSFDGFFRRYAQDSCVQLAGMLQQTQSRIETLRPTILGLFSIAFNKYIPFGKLSSVQLVISRKERRVGIYVTYTLNLPVPTVQRFIVFIRG